ncbi:Eukaryotic translation initiation factor 4B2 [Glycine max]|nr:Eukaryotic translation initiation factor 4B2 [Glycine max]
MLPSLTNKKPKGTTITLAKAKKAEAQAVAVEPQSFPNLKEALNSKPKKKKGTTITLSEFNHGGFSQGLMCDEMLALPTGPKEHSTEEMQFNPLAVVSPPMTALVVAHATAAITKVRGGKGGRRSYGGFNEERKGPNPRVSVLVFAISEWSLIDGREAVHRVSYESIRFDPSMTGPLSRYSPPFLQTSPLPVQGWYSLDTVIAAESLALILQAFGDTKDSKELLERCLNVRKDLLPDDHIQSRCKLTSSSKSGNA